MPKLSLLLLLLILASSPIRASVVLLDQHQEIYVEPFFSTLTTPLEVQNFEQLMARSYLPWQSDRDPRRAGRRAGFSQEAQWYRLTLEAPQTQSLQVLRWQAIVDHALLRRLDAYLVQDGEELQSWSWQVKERDQQFSFSGRPTFDFSLQPGERYDLYVRIESNFSLFMPMTIGSSTDVAKYLLNKLTFLNIFYGVMLGLLIYSLVIAINIRSKATFFYSFYLALILGYNLQINGFIRGWTAPIADSFDRMLVYLCSLGVFVAALFFCRSFLNIQHRSGFFYWLYHLLVLLMLLTAAAAIAGENALFILGMQFISPLFFVYALTAGAISIRQGNRYAILFEVGWLAMAMGTTIHQLLLSGLLPTNFVTQEAMRLGAMVEAFMLSWALALRFKSIEQDSKRIEERYRGQLETANLQLTEALRIENKNNQLKDDFIRVVGHELRTPVNTLVQSFDLLVSPHQDYQTHDFERDSSMALSRLYHHVENLVLASELDSGRAFCAHHWFDLNEFLQAVQLPFKDVLGSQQQRLDLQLPDKGVELFTDSSKLERIVHNLLDNALKFSGEHQVRLEMNLSPAQVNFVVLDTGPGMSELQIRRAHEFMSQSDQSMLRKNEGLGIGLSVCFGLVKLMSGQIHIQSEPTRGTKVQVSLPIQSRERVMDFRPVYNEAEDSIKILVVEDNILNAKLLLSIIRTLKVEVALAANGQQALDMVAEEHYSLVLMDIQMPIMDGFTAAKKIRELGSMQATVPIIAVSANNASSDQRQAIQSGMNDFLSKPISPSILKQKLRRYLPQIPPEANNAEDADPA